jgi:quinol monooxygenase YgiN
MVLLRMRICVDSAQRAKVVSSLSRILGPSRASAGCVNCQLYADLEDNRFLLIVEEWRDQESLIAHLRADNAKVLLSVLDFASDAPEVRLDTLVETKGIRFVAKCRDPQASTEERHRRRESARASEKPPEASLEIGEGETTVP